MVDPYQLLALIIHTTCWPSRPAWRQVAWI